MKKYILFNLLFALSVAGFCQEEKNSITGRYEGIFSYPLLYLNDDSTFEFASPDHVYPFTYKSYKSKGVWSLSGKIITLNPGKERRIPKVTLIEKEVEGQDSISVKINYYKEDYDNEVLVKKEPFDPEMMTLYVNKGYNHLVHARIHRICAFAPRVKRQLVMDSLNNVRLPKQKIEKLALYTYGFDEKVELPLTNPNANYYEITVVQPVDTDRRLRSEQLKLKGKSLYGVTKHSVLPYDGIKKVR